MGLSLYPRIASRQRHGEHFPAARKNCWRRSVLCGPCRIKEKQTISFFIGYFNTGLALVQQPAEVFLKQMEENAAQCVQNLHISRTWYTAHCTL
jgi:hypothetical protein